MRYTDAVERTDEAEPGKNTVIVAGCTHGGLSAIRSYGRAGRRVVAMTYNPDEPALRSRHVDEIAICPHPQDEDEFIRYLLDRAAEWSGAFLLDTNDYYATAMSRHKEALAAHYHLVVPDWVVARIFIEKDRTYELAGRVGVEHPKFLQPRTRAELEDVIDQLTFPVMVKPVRSHEFVRVFRTKLFTVDDAEGLRDRFEATLEAGTPVVICEIIPGTDYRTLERVSLYIDTTGEIAAEIHNTKLRQTPPMFGMCKAGVTTPPVPEVLTESKKLLDACDFRGLAAVEFKRDPRDGRLKLIEVNVRVLADMQHAISAGVDLPAIVYDDIVEGRQHPRQVAEADVFYVHMQTDLFELFSKEKDRLRNARRLLEPYLARRRSYAFFSLRDPMPFLEELRVRVRRFARKKLA